MRLGNIRDVTMLVMVFVASVSFLVGGVEAMAYSLAIFAFLFVMATILVEILFPSPSPPK